MSTCRADHNTYYGSRARVRGLRDVWRGMLLTVPVSPSPTADQTLAGVLLKLRKERDITQEALASNAGLTTRSYQKIERGHTSPEWATVRRIAQALDVGLVELAQAVADAEA